MALPRSLHFPCLSFHPPTPKHPQRIPLSLSFKRPALSPLLSSSFKSTAKQIQFAIRATENGSQTGSEAEQSTQVTPAAGDRDELSELGTEIKKAMEEREKASGGGNGSGGGYLLSGVVEEIGEIEWPDFGKVLGTTGVVLGVIAGSSVVLLTVNAVLAELSDRVFAGKGVQDFFGG